MEKNTQKFQARQGDIFFEEVDTIPEEAVEKKDGVIAEGEVTGHMHRISDGSKAVLMLAEATAYMHALQNVDVVHDEHHAIHFPIGNFKVTRQQVYTPEGWRTVLD